MKNNPTIQAQIQTIQDNFKAIFPNGYIRVGVRSGLGQPYLSIDLGLIGDITDVSNGIRQNDPMYTSLMGHKVSDVEKFELETLQSGLMCEPLEGTHYAMSRVKTSKRKTTNTLDKQVVSLKKYFKTLAKVVKENQDNIYKVSKIPSKYLEIN